MVLEQDTTEEKLSLKPQEEKISYSTTSKLLPPVKKEEPKKIKKKPKDKTIKYYTQDSKKLYKFYLIDSEKTDLISRNTVPFSGKIDGASFTIRVPQELIQSNLRLKIVKKSSGEEKIVDLGFIADMRAGTFGPDVSMEFETAENYQVHFPTSDEIQFPGASIYD